MGIPLSLDSSTVLGISPFGLPNARVVEGVCRGGGAGVLDLGTDDRSARTELELARRWAPGRWGVRVGAGCGLTPTDVWPSAGTGPGSEPALVILAHDATWRPADVPAGPQVLIEVTSVEEARRAAADGAHGLVARGGEAGGRVGDLSSFVLLQRLLAADGLDLPVWVCGGIGRWTAPAAVLGGAAGVVLDTQLALLEEAALPDRLAALITGLDGSETRLVDGRRVLHRPGRPEGPALEIGQDGFLAAQFARTRRTVPDAVRAVRAAITDAVTAPDLAVSVRPGSAGAAALGGGLPVLQGPMTRVSDRPRFAAAVADAGGLPFLALALASAEQSRTLLTEAADALGDRPWGVGILGFVPEELRTAQLKVVLDVRPGFAIIAGGRPAQAAELDAAGVTAFLHVPSPVLLKQFIDGGSRRFVFEGAECGGHVGPRNSFALWEAQCAVLDDVLAGGARADEFTVVFAGGIHDARSAAMVAAMAAPLTRRGVAVGVLMGSAYLFTEEAVREGAIGGVFQERVLAATGTSLLETAPGHATRCVDSPYVTEFLDARSALRAEGVDHREVWERLEALNVGRLRIASKGLERTGSELSTVDADRQLGEGLFMAGQVAVLRSSVTTVARLHEEVTTGAADLLAARAATLRPGIDERSEPEPPAPYEIAVIGMAGVFPQAGDVRTYWSNVVTGTDVITEVSPERWDPAVHYDPDNPDHVTTDSKWGGFIPPIPFDALSYGIAPTSLASTNGDQLLALEVTRQALADAGYADRPFNRERTSVFFGSEGGSDMSVSTQMRTLIPSYFGELPAALDPMLPAMTSDSFTGMLPNLIPGRVANRLDFGGLNHTVDAACASGLSAVEVGCKELAYGNSDLAICGGADLHNSISDYVLFSTLHALSRVGRARVFDAEADGIVLGEAVACVVLKRLADAERDGDRVYAVIRAVSGSSDGRWLGYTAPRPEGQALALDRAYRQARISPSAVSLIEAHGTGTAVGDRAEVIALTRTFTAAGAQPGRCALGSVKSQIGHTKATAGVSALIKAAMAVYTGVLPPTLHLQRPVPEWDPETSPFAFNTAARPWGRPVAERVAGVSAFGFGGTNFHAVVSGHAAAPPAHTMNDWPAELFLFAGRDRDAAVRAVERLIGELPPAGEDDDRPRPQPRIRLRDYAAEACRRAAARAEPVQIAVVADSVTELPALLRRAVAGEHDPNSGLFQARHDSERGRVAMLFPGQGSQRPAMLAELFIMFPDLQRFLDLGPDLVDTMFPATAFDEETTGAQRDALRDTRAAQPALGITGLAMHHLLDRCGIAPDLLGGHSYGELVALTVAGALDADRLVDLSRARAAAILDAAGSDPGAMAAVSAAPAQVEPLLPDGVVVANHNSPAQTVVSGPTSTVDIAVERLAAAGIGARRIPVACAFHSPVVAGAADTLGAAVDAVPVHDLRTPVWSNRTGRPYPADADGIRAEIAAHVAAPVRFADQILAMYDAGARVFIEAGPGTVLTGLVRATLGDRPHLTVPIEPRPDAGLRGFLRALAQLATAGVRPDVGWLFQGRDITPLDTPPSPARWVIDGFSVRTADGEYLPGGLRPAHVVEIDMNPNPPTMSQPTVHPPVVDQPAAPQPVAAQPVAAQPVAAQPVAAQPVPAQPPAGQPAGQPPQAAPAPAYAAPAPAAHAAPAWSEALVMEFLRGNREMVTAQRDVLLAVLTGSTPAPAQPAPVAAQAASLPQPAAVPLPQPAPAPELTAAPPPGPAALPPASVAPALPAAPVTLPEPTPLGTGYDDLAAVGAADFVEPPAGYPFARPGAPVTSSHNGSHAAVDTLVRPAPSGAPDDLDELVREVIAERTGYPSDMIEPDIDLEADLGIDSIRRVEISGDLLGRVGVDASTTQDLGQARTAREISRWLAGTLGADPDAGPDDGPAAGGEAGGGRPFELAAEPSRPDPPGPGGERPVRYVWQEVELPALPDLWHDESLRSLRDRRVAVLGDHDGLVDHITHELVRHGARPAIYRPVGYVHTPEDAVGGVFYVASMRGADEPLLPADFASIRAALAHGPEFFVALCPALPAADATAEVAGLRGLVRTVALEYPEMTVKLVEVDPERKSGLLAQVLTGEVLAADGLTEVRNLPQRRTTTVAVEADLAVPGPVTPDDAPLLADAIGLSGDAVVLLIGGGRGITAQIAEAFVTSSGCAVELAGRTALPAGPEDAGTAAADTAPALRSVLARRHAGQPGAVQAIERAVRQILRERELAATIAELRAHGGRVGYRTLDTLDADAVAAAVKAVHAEHGRLDGVVYGAGITEDQLIANTDPDSFRRVFDTKVTGARALLDALTQLPAAPRFTVLFGSIAAAAGNRGQAAYAAANDALEWLGTRWAERTGNRCLTVHWGPWAPVGAHPGMVSPELQREFARTGQALLDPAEGTRCLLRELAWGDPAVRAVVYTPAGLFGPEAATHG